MFHLFSWVALAILAYSLLTSASAFFQSMDFHCRSSAAASGNLSGFLHPVVEQLPFIGLPPFLAMKYRGISQRPFGPGQSLNPYPTPLQGGRSLFIPFLYPLRHFFPLRGRYLCISAKERIGLTTFRATNNCVRFRSHL